MGPVRYNLVASVGLWEFPPPAQTLCEQGTRLLWLGGGGEKSETQATAYENDFVETARARGQACFLELLRRSVSTINMYCTRKEKPAPAIPSGDRMWNRGTAAARVNAGALKSTYIFKTCRICERAADLIRAEPSVKA